MSQAIQVNGDYLIKSTLPGAEIVLRTAQDGRVVIDSDLVVTGTTTVVSSQDLDIKDNIIVINRGETGQGVTLGLAGIKIDRGSAINVSLLWNEQTDTWGLYEGSENDQFRIGESSRLEVKKLTTQDLEVTGAIIDEGAIDQAVIDDLTVNTFRGVVDSGTYPVLNPGDPGYDSNNNLAKILVKRSFIPDQAPTLNDVDVGEVAINIFDGRMYFRRQYIRFGEEVEEISEFVSSSPIENVIFVQQNGDDFNLGESWDRAVATIERALELAWLREGELTLIELGPGRYITQGNLSMPDNCALRAPPRVTSIRPEPGFEVNNVFLMGSGCFIEGPIFEDWRLDDLENPTKGFAAVFRPGAVIRRAPYVHKIAVRNTPTWSTVAPPLDRNSIPPNPYLPPAGGVAMADGAVCSPYSIYPNIMTWGATPVLHNGIGYCAKNGGLINAVNAVSLWCHKHFYAIDGGQIVLSACSTQFGDFTMVSKGSRNVIVPVDFDTVADGTVELEPAAGTYDTIIAQRDQIVQENWDELGRQGFTETWSESDEEFTKRDSEIFLKAVGWTLDSGNDKPVQDFIKGLFDFNGNFVFSVDKLPAFLFSFGYMRNLINDLPNISGLESRLEIIIQMISDTLNNPRLRREPSVITAVGHTWTAILSGVALSNIPPARNKAPIRESILELDRGIVIASGQDDQGSALFIGGMEINADTGELSGPPFVSAVNRIANRAAIARSF